MEHFAKHRFAALLLALLLAAACILPAAAAAVPPANSVPFTEVTPPEDAAPPPYHQLLDAVPQTVSDEPLRVIIELEKPSLLALGYAAADVTDNAEAAACNEELKQYQAEVIAAIEADTGEPLDVVWRLTVVADLLSAWIQPAQMETVAAVPGVRSVQAEAVAVPLETESGETGTDGSAGGVPGGAGEPAEQSLEPDWMTDYTGDGQRIAIIDTGTDEWHRSLNSGAWMYALAENAEFLAKDLDEYLSDLNLLDEDGIAAVLDELTVVQRHPELLADAESRQAAAAALAGHGEAETVSGRGLRKIAFGANYVEDEDYDDITHKDEEHGSHVAGIAAANRYVPAESCWDPVSGETTAPAEYEPAVNAVKMQGQAPDAQLLVMQVFGAISTYESDFLAAVQDALVLGADAVNLSLGSSTAGETFFTNPAFQSVVNELTGSGAVVAAAHGNSYYFTYSNAPGNANGLPELPYADDVTFNTGGSPSTCDTFLAVAAADTTGAEPRMADFSSWGVPSSLELKPEITAPGHNIYSLNGALDDDPNARHDKYELMSGTSMATPQIAGMAALVTEHLKKRHPDWDDATRRRIAQSLLMSTAVPLADPDDTAEPKNYYPVLQQGAGLADAKKAVTANAYITMDENAVFRPRSAADGKVKAELGQSESGAFQFSFTVHNLDDSPHRYRVRTDLFTQALTTHTDGSAALSTKTTPLTANVQYEGVNELDSSFELEVGGSATVTVKIQIDDPAIANYPAGAYVEGYTYVFEGDLAHAEGDVHSIPLLGFYGN